MKGASITLVAGYPRSGTTFTAGSCAASEAWWHQGEGILELRDKTRPRTGFQLDAGLDRAQFDRSVATLRRFSVRTHSPPAAVRAQFPEVWDRVGRILYVQRHPIEVALSVCRYVIATQGLIPGAGAPETSFEAAAERGEVAAFFRRFCAHRGAPNFLEAWGSWSDHVASWREAMAASGLPGAVLSYDRLVREPVARLLAAADTLGLPWQEEHVRKAVKQMAPEKVRAGIGAFFVGKDPEALRYPDLLGEDDIRLGFATFGAEMLRFGL
ncbi:sulfotransferase domain-containing protein [Roseomonas sp. HJA6]|uniref:Sulfotransferase domain-containing protein n=1 Tax=Roseomonas alba TaxID=2846776 RepID=A0ABS7AEA5_9PROT|nr:sulfotransferase domain-containing protein [Neoroseomonas alba]MBW6400631.1 sulfotransferase domain-containing protein [Neoroseomonas alba]